MKTLALILLIILAFPTAYRVVECTLETDSWKEWKTCVSASYKSQMKACKAVTP